MPTNFAEYRQADPVRYEGYKQYSREYIMKRYNSDETFKQNILDQRKKKYREKKDAHYLRWDTDEEYKKECQAKGMRDCRSKWKK